VLVRVSGFPVDVRNRYGPSVELTGANPISIVVPCHRVIGIDGSLTGYGGGIERKRWLLSHEGAVRSMGGKVAQIVARPRYEGHSALGCCTGLLWRSMLTPTRTAGTAQATQPAP
jgi:hypothetical protein